MAAVRVKGEPKKHLLGDEWGWVKANVGVQTYPPQGTGQLLLEWILVSTGSPGPASQPGPMFLPGPTLSGLNRNEPSVSLTRCCLLWSEASHMQTPIEVDTLQAGGTIKSGGLHEAALPGQRVSGVLTWIPVPGDGTYQLL